jgi:hypothetical protein
VVSPNLDFPFGFAYTLPNTAFNPIMIFDGQENIFGFKIEQTEGECATLTIELKNPREGLNNPGRYQWAWFCWQDPQGHVWPLFYGRQISFPQDFLNNAITIKFIAMPENMLAQKQALAASLMVQPYWDPVFIDAASRLDPDTTLEALSAFWHVDRLSLLVQTSDVLNGEDGTLVFQEADAFWDSVKVGIDKPPLKSVYCEATVSWSQQDIGVIDMGPQSINTYGGDAIIQNWPKAFSQVGAGWSVQYSSATDQNRTALAELVTTGYGFRNGDTTHQFGDIMSIDFSWTRPPGSNYFHSVISEFHQNAIIDQDPDGFNQPTAVTRISDMYVMQWTVNTRLVMRYEANRPRTEQVRFTVGADLQPVFTDPGGVQANFAQDSEFLQLRGSVGIEGPYGDFRGNWAATTQYFIYDYFMVGTNAYQVLRDHMSVSTFDPQQTATLWEPLTLYPAGQNVQVGLLVYAVLVSHESAGAFSPYAIDNDGNLIYTQRINPHDGAHVYQPLPNFRGNWATSVVYVANDIFIGPDGTWYQVQIGHTSTTFARFNTDTTGRLLYALLLQPAPIGNLALASYYPTDRGIQSLEYCILRARARLMFRSRCVKVSFDTYFAEGIHATLRKNAHLFDHRLPGGQAFGKITAYTLEANENQGPIANITIGCAVGNGVTSTAPQPGTPSYVSTGYMATGYQYYTGSTLPAGPGDILFTPPQWAPIDDGLVFPLSKLDAVISETIMTENQAVQEQIALTSAYFGIQVTQQDYNQVGKPEDIGTIIAQKHQAQLTAYAQSLAQTPVWYEAVFKPVVNGPFSTVYSIDTTTFVLPQDINLAAPSSP